MTVDEKNSNRGSVCDCSNCVIRELIFPENNSNVTKYVCKSKIEKKYKKGEIVISSGDTINHLICIKEGLLKIYKTSSSREQIIGISKAFDYSYLLNIFSETSYLYNISAIEDSTVCFVNFDNIKKMINENGSFAHSLLNKLSKASDNIINNMLEINKRNLRGRVALILLFFANEIYKKDIYTLPVSRKEIAELIGMTTENVIRIISEFREENIIRTYSKEIEIKDKLRLSLIMEKG